eukprot:TRINITY_DN2101_c0_g1_i1.p3 TRINITY_DN2101_c0_g1~~TRINITY_DN2101_c0_g1_i1.p3  ORF type:complete len:117 (+),score=22.74 TRINITY_DN2101_c0_g1_i1:674-1024(+)
MPQLEMLHTAEVPVTRLLGEEAGVAYDQYTLLFLDNCNLTSLPAQLWQRALQQPSLAISLRRNPIVEIPVEACGANVMPFLEIVVTHSKKKRGEVHTSFARSPRAQQCRYDRQCHC